VPRVHQQKRTDTNDELFVLRTGAIMVGHSRLERETLNLRLDISEPSNISEYTYVVKRVKKVGYLF